MTEVDKTAATVGAALGLGDAVAQQWGAEVTAQAVLPAITPLLVAPSLSHVEFASALRYGNRASIYVMVA